MGTCTGVWGTCGQRARMSEFLGESPAVGQEGGSFPLLSLKRLVWGTCSSGWWMRPLGQVGASRPCPGLLPPCSGNPEPSHITQRNYFACFTHFHLGRKEPFPKQSLEISHLDRALLQCSRPTLNLLPSPPGLACLQSRVDHSCTHHVVLGAVLALRKFFLKLG